MQKKCLIIPCYNESKRINIIKFIEFAQNENVILLFVNDGSSDSTLSILTQYNNDINIFILDLNNNVGKAEAIRLGMLHALSSFENIHWFSFIDADLATPLIELSNMFSYLNYNKNINILIGSRIKRLGANITRSRTRHIIGRFISTLISQTLHLPIYDTQCGAKIFHKNSIKYLFKKEFISQWLFDVELLARYRNRFGKSAVLDTVHEYPLKNWREISGSKIRLKHFIRIPFELVSIYYEYNIKT